MTRFRRFLVSDHLAGWTFILPSVVLIGLFGLVPIVWGLILSFQKAGLISPDREWVGFENYVQIVSDPKARQAAVNTIYYTIAVRAHLDPAGALRRARAQPQDRLHPVLPPRGVHPGRHVHDRHRDHVPLAVRQELRPGELAARQDRVRAVRVLRGSRTKR